MAMGRGTSTSPIRRPVSNRSLSQTVISKKRDRSSDRRRCEYRKVWFQRGSSVDAKALVRRFDFSLVIEHRPFLQFKICVTN